MLYGLDRGFSWYGMTCFSFIVYIRGLKLKLLRGPNEDLLNNLRLHYDADATMAIAEPNKK